MQKDPILMDIFPLWMHCVDLETRKFVLSPVEFGRLYGSWKEWVGERSGPWTI